MILKIFLLIQNLNPSKKRQNTANNKHVKERNSDMTYTTRKLKPAVGPAVDWRMEPCEEAEELNDGAEG